MYDTETKLTFFFAYTLSNINEKFTTEHSNFTRWWCLLLLLSQFTTKCKNERRSFPKTMWLIFFLGHCVRITANMDARIDE